MDDPAKLQRDLAAYQIDHVAGLLIARSFETALTAILAILLYRVATGKRNSRFLSHLSIAYGVGAAMGLVIEILPAFCYAFMALEGRTEYLISKNFDTIKNALNTNHQFEGAFDSIDLMTSQVANFFGGLSAYLMFRSPDENIPNDVFNPAALLLAFLAVFMAFVSPSLSNSEVALIASKVLDSVIATAVPVALAMGVWHIAARRADLEVLATAVGCLFVGAALAQPAYWLLIKGLLKGNDAASTMLSFCAFGCNAGAGLLTAILAVKLLPDRFAANNVELPAGGPGAKA